MKPDHRIQGAETRGQRTVADRHVSSASCRATQNDPPTAAWHAAAHPFLHQPDT